MANPSGPIRVTASKDARPSLDELADSYVESTPERPSLDTLADSWQEPVQAAAPERPSLDALAQSESDARQAAQLARGLSDPLDVPTDADLYGRANDLWLSVRERARMRGQTETEASETAWATVNGAMRSPSKFDASKLLLPTVDAGIAKTAQALGGESTAAGKVVGALGPNTFTEAGRKDPLFVIPRTDVDRATAESVRAAELHNLGGLPWDEAKAAARKEATTGLLVMENPESRASETAKATELRYITPTVAPTASGAMTDVARGGSQLATDTVNFGKDLLDATVAVAETTSRPVAEAVGVTAGPDAMRAFREWTMPSPFDWLANAETPAWAAGTWLESAQNEARASKERNGGLVSGWSGVLNAAGADIDPTDDGVIDRAVWFLSSTASIQYAPPDKSGTDILEDGLTGLGAAARRLADTSDIEKVREGGIPAYATAVAERAAAAGSAVTTPALEGLGVVTMPEGRETTIGQGMRVAGSLLAGLVTTYGARAVDYALTQTGATSYRTGRTPTGGTPDSAMAALLGPLTADYWYDYGQTLKNGDGVTTEVMRVMDTAARGLPDLSPEARAWLLPGSASYDALVQAGMFGDLLLPLDPIPGQVVTNTAGRGAAFTRGMLAATDAGIGWRDAVPVAAARAAPGLTSYVFRNDPDYREATDALTAKRDADTSAVAGKPVVTDDVDPTMVTAAMLYRYAKREGERGRSFGEMVNGVVPYGEMLTTDQIREVYTRLGIERPTPEATPEVEPAGMRQSTADTLRRMGYTDEQFAGMDDAEGRLRIDEQIKPGDDPNSVDLPASRFDTTEGLDRLRAVAEEEDAPPIGTWPAEVANVKDPAERAGAALSALAQHLGVPTDSHWPRLALQVALSFYDPATGRFVRSDFPTDAVIDKVSAPHLATALNRLRTASPTSIWKAAQAFVRGGTVWLPNDVRLAEEVNRRTRGAVPEKGSLRWLPEGPLRDALTVEDPAEPTTPYQRIAREASRWIERAGDLSVQRRGELKAALDRANRAWSEVAAVTGADPLLAPDVSVVSALQAALANGLPERTGARVATALEAVAQAEAAHARSESFIGAMVRYATALLNENVPETKGSKPRKLPNRERARLALRKMAKSGTVAFTPAQVDLYLTVWDRVAEALVKRKILKAADEWWQMVSYHDSDVPTADGAEARAYIVEELGRFSEAAISLGRTADLAALFHESAHVLRRMLPPEMMAEVDAFVKDQYVGWTRDAEEWFAEQFEWVLSTGTMRLPVGDPLKANPRIGMLNRALRLVAGVLSDVFKQFVGPLRAAGMELSPVMQTWVTTFLDLERTPSRIEPVVRIGDGPPLEAVPVPDVTPRSTRLERKREATRVRDLAAREVGDLVPRFKEAMDAARDGREAPSSPEPVRSARRVVTSTTPPTGHHPSFTGPARKAFMAEVNKRGVKYDDVAKWTESTGRGRPSSWEPGARADLLRELESPETRAAIAGVKAAANKQAPLAATRPTPPVETPAPTEPVRDFIAEAHARTVLETAAAVAGEALVAEAAGRGNPSRVKALKRRLLEAIGAQMFRDDGLDVPAEAEALRAKVPEAARATLEDALVQARGLKANPEARAKVVQDAVDAAVERSTPIRETAPVRMFDALAADATPAPVDPPPGMTAEDGVRPVGRTGTPSLTATGNPRSMWDSKNNAYGYEVMIVRGDDLVVSHTDALAETPGYPQQLQGRSEAWLREGAIEAQASNLEPQKLGAEDVSPATGSPTTWVDDKGRNLVVAGNGRTLAILRALRRGGPQATRYRAFVQATAAALGMREPGPFDVVVRRAKIDPNDFPRAVVLAQNSQNIDAADMSTSEAIAAMTTKTRAVMTEPLILDSATLPDRLDGTSAYQFLLENPAAMRLYEMVEDPVKRDERLGNRNAEFVTTVKGMVLAMLDEGTINSARRVTITKDGASVGILDTLADAVPALGSLATVARERPAWIAADVSRYLGDALDLLAYARGQDMASPKAMRDLVGRLTTQVGFTTARPVPVSRVSMAVAMALHTDAPGFGRRLGEVREALQQSMQVGMFASKVVDPPQMVIDAMTTAAQRKAIPETLPFDHADAVTRANELQGAAIENAEAKRQAVDPLPENPPERVRLLDELDARRQNVDAATGAIRGSNRQLVRGPLRDDYTRGLAATVNLDEAKDPIGLLYRLGRSLPTLSREQLNAALGYAPDARTYDAVDLQARVFALVVGARMEGGQVRQWRRLGLVTAVPLERVAAVRRRADAVLGTLPAAITAAQKAAGVGGSTPLPLSPDVAQRVRLLLDYLNTTGNAEALQPRSLLTRSATELQNALTLWEWEGIVRATHDAVSGVLPYRGRVESYGLAASMLWSLTQRYGGALVPPPTTRGASPVRRTVNDLRRWLGSVTLGLGSFFLPYEDFQPQMAEYVRPRYQRAVREIGSEPAAVVDRLERALSQSARSPTAMVDAIQSLQNEAAFDPIIDVARHDGPSDLDRLRGWLYRDAIPDPSGVKHGRPYPGLVALMDAAGSNGQPAWTVHDIPLAPEDVPTLADIYAQADLVERVLFKAEGMTGDVMAALDALRTRTLEPEATALILMMLYDRLNACAARGTEILKSAAGKSGADKVEDSLAKSPGLALDAYEAFYQGRFASPVDNTPTTPGNRVYVDGNRVVDTSVERLTQQLAVGRAIPTHLWLTEVVIRFNVRRIVDRFLNDLVEMQYVRDLRSYYKDANPDEPAPALVTTYAFGQKVIDGARDILLGKDLDLTGGETAKGVTVPGIKHQSGLTQSERYTAKLLLSRLGILADLPVERKGIKGNIGPTPTTDLFGGSVNAQNLAALLADPKKLAESRVQNVSWDGQDIVLPDTLAQHLFHAVERHAPIGRYLGEVLANRDKANAALRTLKEYVRLIKGNLITGGPNGWTATAMALGGLAGGATPAGVALLALAGGAMSFVPRLPGFVNNTAGAVMQTFMLGPKALVTTLGSPRVAGMASKVTGETVTFRRWGGPLRHAEHVLEGVAAGAIGDLNRVAFTTPDGRVYTLGMVAQISHEYGLDGTQARFEAEEVTDARLTRLFEQHQDQTLMGRAAGLVKSFYGRNVIAENYRKFYESIDAYFRHTILIRGLMDGLTPDEAVRRALLVTFDYSQVSPLDAAFNKLFLFWMYTRRSIDLTLYTLLTNPHRVLGPMRFMRQQDQTSGYGDVNGDYEQQSETVPDYAQGSPAVAYLPLAGANNRAIKIALTEPPQTLALRTMWELGTGDIPAVAGKTTPVVQTVINGVVQTTTGQWIDFFKRRDVASDPRMNEVPAWFVRMDQALGGGSLSETLGISPHEEVDPQRRAQTGDPITWQVIDHPVAWQAVRQLVPGTSTILYQREMADRGNLWGDQAMNAVYEWLATVDPENTAGLRREQEPGAAVFMASDAQPRIGFGPVVEASRAVGSRPMVVASPYAARTAPKRAASADIKGATSAEAQYDAFAPTPDPTTIPVPRVDPSKSIGVDPNKRIGVDR